MPRMGSAGGVAPGARIFGNTPTPIPTALAAAGGSGSRTPPPPPATAAPSGGTGGPGASLPDVQGQLKKFGQAVMVLAGPLGKAAAVPALLLSAAFGVEKLGKVALEAVRDLKRFSPTLSVMFAQMDRQSLILSGRYAQATSGSAKLLGGQTMGLSRELQPLKEMIGLFKNIGLAGLTATMRMVVWALTQSSAYKAVNAISEALKEILGTDNRQMPLNTLLANMEKGNIGFKNRKPGE